MGKIMILLPDTIYLNRADENWVFAQPAGIWIIPAVLFLFCLKTLADRAERSASEKET